MRLEDEISISDEGDGDYAGYCNEEKELGGCGFACVCVRVAVHDAGGSVR